MEWCQSLFLRTILIFLENISYFYCYSNFSLIKKPRIKVSVKLIYFHNYDYIIGMLVCTMHVLHWCNYERGDMGTYPPPEPFLNNHN